MLAITPRETIASVRAATAHTAVSSYTSLERVALDLPAAYQVRLMRAMARELSWSDGVDRIEVGLDRIEADLLAENAQANSYAVEGRAA